MRQPTVAIIVLNYNGLDLLNKCLRSLKQSNYSSYKVLVVDNGSTDGSAEFIARQYPDYVKLQKNQDNLGFSKGNNEAIKLCFDSDYIVLLNNDTEVEPDWLAELIAVAEKDPTIGALQPKLRSLKDRNMFDHNGAAGGYFDRFGYTVCRGRVFYTIEKDTGQYDDVREVFWAGGPAILLRRRVLQEVGLLDEDFQAHFEEIDLCWRIRLAGYRILYVPSAVVYHLWGGTPNSRRVYLNQRNSLFTMIKNYSTANAVKYVSGRVIFDIINIGYTLLRRDFHWTKDILASYLWFAAHPALVMRNRRKAQRLRKVNDDHILRLMLRNSAVLQYFLLKRTTYSRLTGRPNGSRVPILERPQVVTDNHN